MSRSKTRTELAALREAALEDLMATSDANLLSEVLEDGDDIKALALQVKTNMRDTAASTLRHRLVKAKETIQKKTTRPVTQFSRPPLEQIKEIVQSLFVKDKSLGLAFRDGKKQTDSDWLSLYDDLVTMGAIKPDDHGN